jgi:hypothetical protein
MKLLFITTQFPYPLDNGGKMGALNGIRIVSGKYNTTVLSFSEQSHLVEEGVNELSKELNKVQFITLPHLIHIRKKPIQLLKAVLRGFLSGIPYLASKFIDKEMYRQIDKLFLPENYWDVVFIDYINMCPYGEYIKRKYRLRYGVLFFKDHNIEYQLVKQEAYASGSIKKAFLCFETKCTKKYELQAIKNADAVFSVCSDNTDFLKKYNNRAYAMLQTYEILPRREYLTSDNSLLYIGNLSWRPNMEGLKWFISNILPVIEKKMPDVTLTIIGRGSGDNPFGNKDNIKYLGYVDDISEYYENHKVFIVPLLEGSGIRIKILEAFNHDIAVVSTKVGCATINAENEKQLLVADTPVSFAKQCIDLLLKNELNNKIRYSAKNFLSNYYSMERQRQLFNSLVKDKDESI